MSTVWPVVWDVQSNVEVVYSSPRASYVHSTIPKNLDIKLNADMSSSMDVAVSAIPDPDFHIFHYPGITTNTTSDHGTGGDGSPTTTTTTVKKEMPPPPSGIGIQVVESSGEVNEFLNVSGNRLTFVAGDTSRLFPFELIEYTKDGIDYSIVGGFPDQLSDDDYDVITTMEPSSKFSITGWVKIRATSSSTINPTMTISVTITNDYTYWQENYIDHMMAKTAEFYERIAKEEQEIQELTTGEDSPSLLDFEDDYVEITPDMFTETELRDDATEGGSESSRQPSVIEKELNRLIQKGDMDTVNTEIEKLVAHTETSTELGLSGQKYDMLFKALQDLRGDAFHHAMSSIRTVYQDIIQEYKILKDLQRASQSHEKKRYNSTIEVLNEILNIESLPLSTTRQISIVVTDIEDGKQEIAGSELARMIKQIRDDYEFQNPIAHLLSHMVDRNRGEAVNALEDILNVDTIDGGTSTSSVTHTHNEEATKVKVNKVSKDDLNSWFDQFFKKD